jgi:hypothetical protein
MAPSSGRVATVNPEGRSYGGQANSRIGRSGPRRFSADRVPRHHCGNRRGAASDNNLAGLKRSPSEGMAWRCSDNALEKGPPLVSWETLKWAGEQRTNNVAMQCVLFVIANAADPDGVAFRWWKSKTHWWCYIAERAGMARGSIYRTIDKLEALGLLSLEDSNEKARPLVRLNLDKIVVLERKKSGKRESPREAEPVCQGDSPLQEFIEDPIKSPTALNHQVQVADLFTPEAVALALDVLKLVGADPLALPLGWYDIHGCAQRWLDGGWKVEIILRKVVELMNRPGACVPRTPRYFESAIADAHWEASAPLPTGIVRSKAVRSEGAKERRNREWIDARASLDEAIARRRAARDGSGAAADGVLPEWCCKRSENL